MPFTLSHTAAVLPFARALRRRGLLSAAVIGSMVPDFGLFLPWNLPRHHTHSLSALVTFCLPVGLVAFWLYQLLIKPAVAEVLPDRVYSRWVIDAAPARLRSLRQWALAGVGILLGALTHVIWDGFTHEGARGVRLFPALDDPAVDIGGHIWLGYRLLQHLSSIGGLGVVVLLGWRALRGAPASAPSAPRQLSPAERYRWCWTYGVTTITVAAITFVTIPPATYRVPGLPSLLGHAAVVSLWGLAAALILVSACLQLRLRNKQ
jgi:hypothetical protein